MAMSAWGGQVRRRDLFRLDLGRRHRPDYWLVAICALLLGIGLIVVYAISPALSASAHVGGNYYVLKQLTAISLSVVAFILTAQIPLEKWRQASKTLLIIAISATLLALVLPVNPVYPAHRWVRLGSLSFQSVELVKFAALVWLAGFLAERITRGTLKDVNKTFKPLLIALGVAGVIVAGIQSDLGSAGVLVAMVAALVFIAGLPMKRILLIGGVILIGGILAISVTPYRRDRLTTFLHPEKDCQSAGYQACQSLISIGSGGMIGLGLGRSVQAYGYQPEAANDSIFAIYAEKFGFIGSIVLLGIFVALFSRLSHIAERAPDDFSRLLVTGVLAWFSVQALINIGGMIGLLPLKGITLPFISYGGTSVVFVAAAVGLVFQVSRYTSFAAPRITGESKRRNYDNSHDRGRLRGAYHPDFGGRV
ncbi:MAG TPA: putative peptidoglycan glycosyltransferase FtsW [Candidatus Saccharimonadales bacterium]|nr:putative peptidoglycan glycosyltransferase FtsW [Candidatus Saccharimonadales bacterium]